MSLITIPNTFSAGAVIIASQHNANFSTIYSDYNGNIDNNNIAPGAAIVYSKLNLAGGIVNADIASGAGIVASKLDLTSPGPIGSVAPNTGAFTTLKIGSTNQGDIFYDNGTSVVRLPPGTSGQALLTQGAAANPIWGNATGIKFVSSTTITAATTSGNIAITAGKQYLVSIVASVSTDSLFTFIFNADTAANYQYAYGGNGGSATIAQARATGQTAIKLGATAGTSGGDIEFCGYLNITYPSNNVQAPIVVGKIMANWNTGGHGYIDLYGFWRNAANPTSFALISDNNYTGKVYLYELVQA